MDKKLVWIPKLPDNFPNKNMEANGYILPDETDIDWYNPDANPKEYTITTAAQLRGVSWLTNNVNKLDFKDWTLKLGANIELNGTVSEPWTPISGKLYTFKATFDGQGYTVSGVYVDGGYYSGFFGRLGEGGIVQNVGIVDSDIKGKNEVGGIAGLNNTGSTIRSCYFKGTVEGEEDANVGGIVANNAGTIHSCYSMGTVTGKESISVGGIVGYFGDGPITNCFYLAQGDLKGVGVGSSAGTTDKTEAQFYSGEVAWELKQNPEPKGTAWGQDLNTANTYPVLNGEDVYKVTFEQNPPIYGNQGKEIQETDVQLPTLPGYTVRWNMTFPYSISKDEDIKAEYTPTEYIIKVDDKIGGSVTAKMGSTIVTKATIGEEITQEIIPAEGYEYVENSLTVTNMSEGTTVTV